MNKALAISILFLAQAAAKLSFGVCPIPNFKPFNDYQTEVNSEGETYYYHKVVWGDKDLENILKMMIFF